LKILAFISNNFILSFSILLFVLLAVRKWRKQGTLGGGKWETEVGDESPLRNLELEGMMESSSNVSLNESRFFFKCIICLTVIY